MDWDRPYNGQNQKYKKKNNDLQHITPKTIEPHSGSEFMDKTKICPDIKFQSHLPLLPHDKKMTGSTECTDMMYL
jgi:hypothetical protein